MTTLLYMAAGLFAIGVLQSISLKHVGAQIGCLFMVGIVGIVVVVSILNPLTPEQEQTAQQSYAVAKATMDFESHCQWQWKEALDDWICVDWKDVDWKVRGVKQP